jgi:hypothetical protein
MRHLVLAGLEAHNPLGFLAALGLLRVLDYEAARAGREKPRLGFVDVGAFVAYLLTPHTLEEIIAIVLRDAAAQADNRALQFAYDADGMRVPPTGGGATLDLKPSPAGARELLDDTATADPPTAALAAAWFSELVQDKTKGRIKPTAFHFTAGNQAFLKIVEAVRRGLTADQLREALVGPWLNSSQLPSLRWDVSVTRLYALRAEKPADDKQGSEPAANWLAVLGLAFFPVVAQRGRLVTTGVTGGWNDSAFTWPVWSPAAEVTAVASLLRIDAATWTQRERDAYGVETVLQSRIIRSDQGGYGSFAPSSVVSPAADRARKRQLRRDAE